MDNTTYILIWTIHPSTYTPPNKNPTTTADFSDKGFAKFEE
jgi:hypothetical protein